MKNLLFTLTLLYILIPLNVNAQGDTFIRSSLNMILIEDFGFDNGELVEEAYKNYEFPVGVYNDHNIPLKSMFLSDYLLTPEEEEEYGVSKSMAGELLSASVTEGTAGIIQDNSKVEFQLMKYAKENKLAHEIIKRWFNIADDGSFNQNYVHEMINVQLTKEQELEALASGSESAEISKNREYLIDNTYVVFTRMNFISNEIVALPIYTEAMKEIEKMENPLVKLAAEKAAQKIYEKTREGYSVWTTGWLFDLVWDDESFNKLRSSTEMDESGARKINLEKFYDIDFKMNFLGKERATSLVTFSLRKGEGNRTEKEILDLSTNRNIDKVLVKLQRGYEQFMPIFPLQSDSPPGAYLGTKEGIDGGEKFEVLQKNPDGSYKSVGTITVDKKKVWDNQYQGSGTEVSDGMTYFKGKLKKGQGKGTLIRQKR